MTDNENGPKDEALTDAEIAEAQGGEIRDGEEGGVGLSQDQDGGRGGLDKAMQGQG